MKKYQVRSINKTFYKLWHGNIKWAVSHREQYSIKCVSREQLDHCIAVMREVNPDARFRPANGLPVFVRWFDSGHIGDIIAISSASSAGQYMNFAHIFMEADDFSSGLSVEVSDESISVLSKRLDGHVITL